MQIRIKARLLSKSVVNHGQVSSKSFYSDRQHWPPVKLCLYVICGSQTTATLGPIPISMVMICHGRSGIQQCGGSRNTFSAIEYQRQLDSISGRERFFRLG
tara:strand:+ start:529 stop:831 length:303 start_codon:yes stop_codon:yes gene_type:complete